MQTKSVEDYVKAIQSIIEDRGYARISDISSYLNIQPSSVTEMMQKLDGKLVRYKKYGGVTLTQEGKSVAIKVKDRYEILKQFLEILDIDKEIAEKDACRIEHYTDQKTMDRLKKFVRFVQNAPKDPIWLDHFKHYYKTGERLECKEKC